MTDSPASRNAPREPTADPLVGTLIGGKYRISALIGRGGGGRVYKGVQEPLGRFVAVKVLGPIEADSWDPEMQVKRFLREATITSQLHHQNTVIVHDYGALPRAVGMEGTAGGLYLVMEFLDGATLRQILNKEAPFSVGRALRIATQIAGSLAEAHDHGVVHRDLKPPNVMLVPRGRSRDFVKVLDFGLVKSLMASDDDVTRERSLLGSPHYMSPEQAVGEPVDQRSDIYSFGSTLYEMLIGHAPFRPGNERAELSSVLRAVLTDPPMPFAVARPDLEIPDELEALVMQCLAKRAADRPQSMHDVLEFLEAMQAAVPYDESRSRQAPIPGGPRSELISLHDPRPQSASSIQRAAVSRNGPTANVPAPAAPDDAVTPSRLGRAPASARALTARPPLDEPESTRKWWFVGIGAGLAAGGLAALIILNRTPDAVAPAVPSAGPATTVANVDGAAAPDAPAAPPEPSDSPSVVAAPPPNALPVVTGAASPSNAVLGREHEGEERRPAVALSLEHAPSTSVALHIESNPTGADVLIAGAVVGRTPFDHVLPRAQLASFSATLQLRGHEPATVTPGAGPESRQNLSSTLVAKKAARPPGTKPPGKTPPSDIKMER
ncbi:MAG: protein kinase [Myxococcales bacterium]|nr:protein kinase [Myxococcales bacterium]